MVQILNDEEFIEAVFGALGWIISSLYFQKTFIKENIIVIGGIAWSIVWFVRKIGMRVYRKLKIKYKKNKEYGINVKNFTNLNDDLFRSIIFALVLCVTYLILIHSSTLDDGFSNLTINTYGLVVGFGILGLLVYVT